MNLVDILDIKSIAVKIKVNSKKELLDLMVDLASLSGKITDKIEVRNEVEKREELMSTGIGKGIALPHAKSKKITDNIAAFATLENPIDFNSQDGMPVNIVFLLLSREGDVANHLRLLGKISKLLSKEDIRAKLINAENQYKIYDILVNTNDMT